MCNGNAHTHSHLPHNGLFVDPHASWRAELTGAPETVKDSPAVAQARQAAKNGGAKEIFTLGDALSAQLRYREAAKYYDEAAQSFPIRRAAVRRLALCRMKTGMFTEAEAALHSLDDNESDPLDINYRIALCAYYRGDFSRAARLFRRCVPLAADGDMHVAAVYWRALSLLRSGENANAAARLYDDSLPLGHHFGYAIVCRVFKGELTLGDAEEQARRYDDLTRLIVAYAAARIRIAEGADERTALAPVLADDEYWASFAWLAAFADSTLFRPPHHTP